METGSSCVFPKPMQSQDITYDGKEHEPWLSEMDEGFTVSCFTFTHTIIHFCVYLAFVFIWLIAHMIYQDSHSFPCDAPDFNDPVFSWLYLLDPQWILAYRCCSDIEGPKKTRIYHPQCRSYFLHIILTYLYVNRPYTKTFLTYTFRLLWLFKENQFTNAIQVS